MEEWFSRTELLLGKESVERLSKKKAAIFGIGGVGGYVAEGLARSGIGKFYLIDSDTVCVSNLNRQIIATMKTIGRYKTEVMKERILDINPNAEVNARNCFYLPETASEFDFSAYDYVVDAVDTVTAKINIIMQAKEAGVPVISAMGAGNKLDPTMFEVADIYKTQMCPLAKVMRHELKKRGVKSCKVVYSKEVPIMPKQENVPLVSQKTDEKQEYTTPGKRSTPGSVAFVPSVAGLIIAGEVVKDLLKD